jgi:hypothetical protein
MLLELNVASKKTCPLTCCHILCRGALRKAVSVYQNDTLFLTWRTTFHQGVIWDTDSDLLRAPLQRQQNIILDTKHLSLSGGRGAKLG